MVLVLAALIKALVPINKGLMNGGFLVKGLLVRSAKDGVIGNSIFRDFQSICGLYLSSQESPRIIGAEGVLIILNTMDYYGF
jgi:hypothetical protein